MAEDAASLARLSLAVHGAIPPSIFSVLINSLLTTKTFKPCKLVGELLPESCIVFLRKCYVFCNVLLLAGVGAFLRFNCSDGVQASCLPTQTLVVMLLLLLLWTDRIVLAFLNAPGASRDDFFVRVARGTACVGLLMAVSENDPSWRCFLILCLANRYCGAMRLARPLKTLDRSVRMALVAVGVYSVAATQSSRRLAVLCSVCAIHTR